jgi:hypothetical protein
VLSGLPAPTALIARTLGILVPGYRTSVLLRKYSYRACTSVILRELLVRSILHSPTTEPGRRVGRGYEGLLFQPLFLRCQGCAVVD